MAIVVDKSITNELRGKQSVMKRLKEIVRMADKGKDIPKTTLKPSGEGKQGRYEGYITLNLWHAKLDVSGQNHGNPLLVLQKLDHGDYVSVGLADHNEYAVLEEDLCRRWLWDHRGNIDWDVSQEAQALLQSLDVEFSNANPNP